jgi:hypothetical protein
VVFVFFQLLGRIPVRGSAQRQSRPTRHRGNAQFRLGRTDAVAKLSAASLIAMVPVVAIGSRSAAAS